MVVCEDARLNVEKMSRQEAGKCISLRHQTQSFNNPNLQERRHTKVGANPHRQIKSESVKILLSEERVSHATVCCSLIYRFFEFIPDQRRAVCNISSGYVLYGFEEMAQWHSESNTSVSLHLKRWRSSNSIYLVFTHYRIVSPYHCDKGIEVSSPSYTHSPQTEYLCAQVDCSDNTAVFAHCFPSSMLPLLLDGLPFCDFQPLHSSESNRLAIILLQGTLIKL